MFLETMNILVGIFFFLLAVAVVIYVIALILS